jgi:hypothetical protein
LSSLSLSPPIIFCFFGAVGCILALVVILGGHRRLPLLSDRSMGGGILEAISSLYGVTGVHSKEARMTVQ